MKSGHLWQRALMKTDLIRPRQAARRLLRLELKLKAIARGLKKNDVTDKTSRQHTTQAESDAVTTENKRNEFPSDKNADSPLRPHQRTNDVAGPANLRQDAESIPNENDATNENDGNSNYERKDDKNHSRNQGGDITVPGISNEDENDAVDANKNTSLRGGKYNLRPNPNPNYSEEYRY